MPEIILNTGKVVLISDEDIDLKQYLWSEANNYGYRWNGNGTEYLHKVIAARINLINSQIDHKDRNSLNCKRQNLRKSSQQQNRFNSSLSKTNQSGYKGVSFDKRSNKYRACICKEGNQMHIGYYKSDIEAARAYDRMAKALFGEFAVLNGV